MKKSDSKKSDPLSKTPLDPLEHPVVEWFSVYDNLEWRVDRFDILVSEIPELRREDLKDFHVWVREKMGPRSWMIVRRLFAFMPKILPVTGNPDDYRIWGKNELAIRLQIDPKQLLSELEAVRLGWRRRMKIDEDTARPNLPASAPVEERTRKFTETDNDELLIRFSISPNIFVLPTRHKDDNRLEKAWFCKRIREWEPLLTKSTMTEQLAKDTLFNELRLRREQDALWALDLENSVGIAARKRREGQKNAIAGRIAELQKCHASQLEDITIHAPWFNVSEAQISATGAIGQLVQGIQEWEAHGDNKIIDGVFSSPELQVMIRTNRQMPEPRYRWGWVMYVNESKKWLWDPQAKSTMSEKDLARFDNGFKAGVKLFNETSDDRVVDLESDGPDGKYEDLKLLQKK